MGRCWSLEWWVSCDLSNEKCTFFDKVTFTGLRMVMRWKENHTTHLHVNVCGIYDSFQLVTERRPVTKSPVSFTVASWSLIADWSTVSTQQSHDGIECRASFSRLCLTSVILSSIYCICLFFTIAIILCSVYSMMTVMPCFYFVIFVLCTKECYITDKWCKLWQMYKFLIYIIQYRNMDRKNHQWLKSVCFTGIHKINTKGRRDISNRTGQRTNCDMYSKYNI